MMVQGGFSTGNPTQLAPGVTDYWINQVYQNMKSVSNQISPDTERDLRQRLHRANRLSTSRNLVANGGFANLTSW
ncbi:hypothetical protein CN602_25250 [Bacillus cereus]|uniref:hypothetical protein n=1 Tax=Bacillus cereus TaxID=1396 RepID=UPI000BF185C3|nr:hypothetical protein [Bacillus cereus]PEL96952.1 hypothetical protein CN602_25250 [Bacillus cereus]